MDYSYEIMMQKIRENPQDYLRDGELGMTPEEHLRKAKSFKLLRNFISGYKVRQLMEAWGNKTDGGSFENLDEARKSFDDFTEERKKESMIPRPSETTKEIDFAEFLYFVHEHYDCMIDIGGTLFPKTSHSPMGLIAVMSRSDEEAFDSYFELREAFIKKKGEKRAYPKV
jgi:hypothetical protein